MQLELSFPIYTLSPLITSILS